MNPIIAASIVTQRQQELLASAEHYRRIRRTARTPRARKVSLSRAEPVQRPRVNFPEWLAAGRL